MSKIFAIFLGIIALVAANRSYSEFRSAFQKFEVDFEKKYASAAERESKFKVFARNVQKIEAFNKKGHSYHKGINQFSDLTGNSIIIHWNFT